MATTKIQTFGGNIAIGTDDPGSYKLKVVGGNATFGALEATSISINGVTNIHIPAGIIGLWADPNNIPSGWVICDGNNGTPNMGGKFAISYDGATYNVGGTGGANSITLVNNNIPSHTHTHPGASSGGSHSHNATVSTDGSHAHTGGTDSSGAHAHAAAGTSQFITIFASAFWYSANDTNTGGNHTLAVTDTRSHNHGVGISSAGTHSHSATVSNSGSHNHPASTGNAGQVTPTAVDIKPAYHTLCFIMKT